MRLYCPVNVINQLKKGFTFLLQKRHTVKQVGCETCFEGFFSMPFSKNKSSSHTFTHSGQAPVTYKR